MKKGTKLFKNTTLTDKIALFIKNTKNFPEIESRTTKYRVFKGEKLFYFVGRSGAVRTNFKNTVSGSRSQTPVFKKLVIDWANIQNPEEEVEV